MHALSPRTTLTLSIFAVTYLALAGGRLPKLKVDRPGVALIGAVAMLISGAITGHEAVDAVDFSTIALLFGMMIVVANLRLSGVFRWLAARLFARQLSGFAMLGLTILTAGALAAFFINDVVCVVLTPVIIEAAAASGVNPVPLLLGLATASNIGSAATITGNPQNMIVAGFAKVGYAEFASRLAPAAVLGLLVAYAVIAAVYKRELQVVAGPTRKARRPPVRLNKGMAAKSVVVAIGAIVGFISGFPTALVALSAAAVLLVTRRLNPQRVYREIDWPLLVMFAGLFVIVAAAEKTGFQEHLIKLVGIDRLRDPVVLAAVTTVLSNLVSNVPAVLLFKPVFGYLGHPTSAALLLASASTYAGNLTVLGSIANLIVLENARSQGVRITFYDYLRVGLPITLLTIALSVFWLEFSK